MNTLLVVILILVGVALLVIELFFIPGFGLPGIAGFLSMIGGVGCAYMYLGTTAGHITFAASIVLCAIAIYIFVRGRVLDRMALQENIDSKVSLLDGTNIAVGSTGIAISRLAPMGKVRIGQAQAEAKSADIFIDEGTEVEVVALEGNAVIVKPIN